MSVSQKTHDEANAFIQPLQKMMMLIDDLRFSDDRTLTDGMYLEMMNTVQELNKLKDQVKTSVIYVEAERRSRMNVVARKKASDMKDDPNYTCCPKCKKYMTKDHYYKKHSKTKTCGHIEMVRKINAVKGTGNVKSKKKCAPPQLKLNTVGVEATLVVLNDEQIGWLKCYCDDDIERIKIPTKYQTQSTDDVAGKYIKKRGKWVKGSKIIIQKKAKKPQPAKKKEEVREEETIDDKIEKINTDENMTDEMKKIALEALATLQ